MRCALRARIISSCLLSRSAFSASLRSDPLVLLAAAAAVPPRKTLGDVITRTSLQWLKLHRALLWWVQHFLVLIMALVS